MTSAIRSHVGRLLEFAMWENMLNLGLGVFFWLCLRSVLVFQPTRANTDGGVEASKLRAANAALK